MSDKELMKRIKKIRWGGRRELAELAGIPYAYLLNMANGYAKITEANKVKIEKALRKLEQRRDT